MSNSKQILALLRTRAEGDEDTFYSIALMTAENGRAARNWHRS